MIETILKITQKSENDRDSPRALRYCFIWTSEQREPRNDSQKYGNPSKPEMTGVNKTVMSKTAYFLLGL